MAKTDKYYEWLLTKCEEYQQNTGKTLLAYSQALALSPDQAAVLYHLCQEEYDTAFLTGAAGTGKSYTVKLLKEIMQAQGVQVYRTAATGVAAQLIGGMTVHSFLGLRGFDVLPAGYWEDANCCSGSNPRRSLNEAARSSMMNYQVSRPVMLIVDEVSMLTSEQLVLIYQTANKCLEIMENEHPLKLLLVGDLRQLAPVKSKDNLYPIHHHFCFEDAEFTLRRQPPQVLHFGSVFKDGPFERGKAKKPWRFISYGLYHQHRQDSGEVAFQEALHYLGRGHNLDHPKVRFLRERVYFPQKDGKWANEAGHVVDLDQDLIEATHLFMRNGNKIKGEKSPWHWRNTVGEHNEKVCERLRKNNHRNRTYYARITRGIWSEEEILDYFKPIPSVITLYEGMRFLCRHNYCQGLANGTMTKVVGLYADCIEVEVIDTGQRFTLNSTNLPLPEINNGFLGEFRTCAFGQVGNAMTFWACQGMTLRRRPNAQQGEDCLVVHLDKKPRQEQGLFYVACSRVESAEQLYILAQNYQQVNNFIYCDPRMLSLMDEAEDYTRSLTGEDEMLDKLEIDLNDEWETQTGYAYHFFSNHRNYPQFTLLFDEQDQLLACSQNCDKLEPIELPKEIIDQCLRLIQVPPS